MAPPKFGLFSTAQEVVDAFGSSLSGKTALITGGNSGIGTETARVLAHAGARVLLTSRNVAAGEAAAKRILADRSCKGTVVVKQLDLADSKSIRALAADLLASEKHIDFLILNAGVMACRYGVTQDGFENQIGTNHLGHFLLTNLLLPLLRKQGRPVRIVVVSSIAHRLPRGLDIEDLHFQKRPYHPWRSYGQSKVANILFAKELNRRLQEEGIQAEAYALHPGSINTNLGRHSYQKNAFVLLLVRLASFIPGLFKTIPQGAATTVYAALSPDLAGKGGSYLSNCGVVTPSHQARDRELAKRLWQESEKQWSKALGTDILS